MTSLVLHHDEISLGYERLKMLLSFFCIEPVKVVGLPVGRHDGKVVGWRDVEALTEQREAILNLVAGHFAVHIGGLAKDRLTETPARWRQWPQPVPGSVQPTSCRVRAWHGVARVGPP